MHYCLVICRVSSTGHIYPSRLGDKCDRSMTLGKLLDYNAQFFNSDLGFVGSFVENDLDYHDLKVKIIEMYMYILIICRRYPL